MNETELAAAISRGEVPSPSALGSASWLFALRLTGTGLARRTAERVWRSPETTLTPEAMARTNGLPVIWEHPEQKTLNGNEWVSRAIGAVMLPFRAGRDGIARDDGDELWGVARIHDAQAAALMMNPTGAEPCSTSPCCVFNKESGNLVFGNLLIEGEPVLWDHVAVVPSGVWDKGAAPSGVRVDTATSPIEKDPAMADEKDENTSKILEVLDSICGRLDKTDSRMQVLENAEADRRKAADARKKADEDETPEPPAAATGGADRMTSGVAMNDRKRADMDTRNPPPIGGSDDGDKPEDYVATADAQAEANNVANVFGHTAGPRLHNERVLDYRVRMARKYQQHSPEWRGIALHDLPDEAKDVAVRRVFADAYAVGANPANVPAGQLREHVQIDAAGRRISTFYGSPRAWMKDFRLPPQYLVKINRNPDKVD